MSAPVPTGEEYLAQPEIQAVLEKRPEIKAFLDKHPFVVLGRAAYEAHSKTFTELKDNEVFDTKKGADPDLQNKRLFAAAAINDEYLEKRFQASARGPADGNQYDDLDGCLLEVWRKK
ncbi:hypothetical protein RB601_004547 [Gaeumannomyces tritici]